MALDQEPFERLLPAIERFFREFCLLRAVV
jgi:hypothetical protein